MVFFFFCSFDIRYDEWIRPDRVVSVLDRPEASKFSKLASLSKQVPGVSYHLLHLFSLLNVVQNDFMSGVMIHHLL